MNLRAVRQGVRTLIAGGPSAKQTAIGGTFWTLTGFGGAQVLRLASNLVATRLLFPELFGLMALVVTIQIGLALFSDVGLGFSIVRHKRGEERRFLDTAWTIQIIRGFVLWFATIAVTPAAAAFYEDDRLTWLLPLAGFSAVIGGFYSTSIFLMRRRLQVRRAALLELGSQVVGIVVMLVWAYLSPTIFSLVAGGMASTITTVVASHLLNRPGRDGIDWDRDAVRELIGFGKWIFVSTALTFLATQADRLLLGKFYALGMLGFYNIAFGLADAPRALVIAVAGKVIFPLLAQSAEIPRHELVAKISRPRARLLTLGAVLLALLVGFGDVIIWALYDERYHEAAWMMPLLAASVWPSFLSRTLDSMLLVVGKPKIAALGYALSFVFLLAGAIVGDRVAGSLGAIIAIALSPLPYYVVTAVGLRGEKFWLWRQDFNTTLLFIGTTLAIFAGRSLVEPYPALLVELARVTS